MPAAPAWLFVAQDVDRLAEYDVGWSLRDVFAPNGDPAPGIVTTHDEFAISWTADEAAAKVERLLATTSETEACELFKLCSQDQWRYARAKQELANGEWRERIVPILYRPFDVRWTVYDRNVAVHRRERASDHLIARTNIALVTSRQRSLSSEGWANVWVTTHCIESCSISNKTKEINYGIPLWLFPRESTDLLDTAPREKTANLAPEFIAALTAAIGHTPTPEATLAWIYAVLYSPSHRARYADFLKRDFPRIPLPTDDALFARLVAAGTELIALHTMEATLPRITRYDIAGSNEVLKVRWVAAAVEATSTATPSQPPPAPRRKSPWGAAQGEETIGARVSCSAAEATIGAPSLSRSEGEGWGGVAFGRVYINDAQYFDDVPQAVWDTHIGGYRVAEKWLKDRKGRQLSYDDLTHYQAVIAALARTLALQADIDSAITEAGGWPLLPVAAESPADIEPSEAPAEAETAE